MENYFRRPATRSMYFLWFEGLKLVAVHKGMMYLCMYSRAWMCPPHKVFHIYEGVGTAKLVCSLVLPLFNDAIPAVNCSLIGPLKVQLVSHQAS